LSVGSRSPDLPDGDDAIDPSLKSIRGDHVDPGRFPH
jgi:hypothetical protein